MSAWNYNPYSIKFAGTTTKNDGVCDAVTITAARSSRTSIEQLIFGWCMTTKLTCNGQTFWLIGNWSGLKRLLLATARPIIALIRMKYVFVGLLDDNKQFFQIAFQMPRSRALHGPATESKCRALTFKWASLNSREAFWPIWCVGKNHTLIAGLGICKRHLRTASMQGRVFQCFSIYSFKRDAILEQWKFVMEMTCLTVTISFQKSLVFWLFSTASIDDL